METILIVEDEPTMLRGLRDNFEFAGYKVITASDGETGVQAARGKARSDHPGYHVAKDQRLRGLPDRAQAWSRDADPDAYGKVAGF